MDTETNVRRIFSQRFRTLRKEKGLSQAEMANLLNFSKTTISLYERADTGKGRLPDAESLHTICSKLGVSSDYLLGFADEMMLNDNCFDAAQFDRQYVIKTRTETSTDTRALSFWEALSLAAKSSILMIHKASKSSHLPLFFKACSDYVDARLIKPNNRDEECSEDEDYIYCKRKLKSSFGYIPVSSTVWADYILNSILPRELRSLLDEVVADINQKPSASIEDYVEKQNTIDYHSLLDESMLGLTQKQTKPLAHFNEGEGSLAG